MNRRNFIQTLMASGVLGSSPLAAQAASELFTPGAALPMMIIGQSGLPHADELVARLRQVLVAAGIEYDTRRLRAVSWPGIRTSPRCSTGFPASA